MQIVLNRYPHIWPYIYSCLPDSPFRDMRVRKAMNLAIDRDGHLRAAGRHRDSGEGLVPPGHPWFGTPSFNIRYDPAEREKLLTEAGYGPDNPCQVTFLISTAGSGQMQPLPMNEAIKEHWRTVGFAVTLQAMDWEALRARRRAGAAGAGKQGRTRAEQLTRRRRSTALIRVRWSKMVPPRGHRLGLVQGDEVLTRLCAGDSVEFDLANRTRCWPNYMPAWSIRRCGASSCTTSIRARCRRGERLRAGAKSGCRT